MGGVPPKWLLKVEISDPPPAPSPFLPSPPIPPSCPALPPYLPAQSLGHQARGLTSAPQALLLGREHHLPGLGGKK